MKKPWVLFTVVVVGSVALIGALAMTVNHFGNKRRAQEAWRQEAAAGEWRQGTRGWQQAPRTAEMVNWTAAAEAFNGPRPSLEDVAEFAPFFQSLGEALVAEDIEEVKRHCDLDRTLDEIIRVSGWGLANPVRTKAELAHEFRDHLAGWLMRSPPWLRTDICCVKRTADGSEAIVYAIHRPAPGESVKMQWWLVKRTNGWKVFDGAELFEGIWATRQPAIRSAPEIATLEAQLPGRYVTARDAIAAGTDILNDDGKWDEADRLLAPARGIHLPREDAAKLALLEGRILLKRRQFDEALAKFDETSHLYPGVPAAYSYRAVTYMEMGRYNEALAEVHAYRKQIGPDISNYAYEGVALEWLSRNSEAAAVYRIALDDDPDCAKVFNGLRRALPDDQKAELGERFARVQDPGKLFDELTNLARQDDDDVAVEIYDTALRKLRPNDPRGITAHIRRLVNARMFAEAATEMRSGLERVTADNQSWIVNSYLYAMLGADRVTEAYQAVPAARRSDAFRLLADDLEDSVLEFDEARKYTKQLDELIAVHKKHSPADPWTGYFEGVILQGAREYERAERAYAAAQTVYRNTPRPKQADDNDPDWYADRFRYRRVECFHALKQGNKAYAEVGPVKDTFVQLAHAYESDSDWEALEALIATHRQKQPEDRNGPFWAANVLYLRGKYADAANALQQYLAEAADKDPNTWLATDRCVRASLRAGQPRDARRMMEKYGQQRVGPALRVAIALAENRLADAEAILEEQSKDGGRHDYLYYDEDFSREIAAPAFAELRKKYPDPRPVPKGTGRLG